MRKLKKYKPTKFKAKTSTYNKELADYAVAFIESLCHTKGTWAGHPFELIDWQEQIIRDLFGTVKPNGYRQFNTAYIEIPKKQGKQLALDTPIPTPDGWKTIGELTVGDQVFDETGTPCNIVAKSAVDDTEQAYRLTFRDGSSIVAGERHLWDVEYMSGKPRQKEWTTGKIYRRVKNHKDRCSLIRIPVARPLKTASAELKVEPFLYGSMIRSEHKPYARIHPDYLRASKGQRQELLRGILGSARNVKTGIYTTTIRQLAEDVRELLWSLSIRNIMTEDTDGMTGKTRYVVRFTAVFRSERKKRCSLFHYLDSIEPMKEKVSMQCIQVDSRSHCYLAGRSFIPTHNSELAAAVALLLCCGDGEEGAEVYGCAADRQQASIVFEVAADMVRMCPALSKRVKILSSQKRMVFRPTNSFYQVLSAEAYSKHGFNIHGVVFDELHTQPNRELFDVMTKGSGDARMQPLYFLITTAGTDTHSICYEVHQKAMDILEGRKHDPTFYPVIYGASEQDDWTDPKVWKKANPSLGITVGIDKVKAACESAKETPSEENVFRQLRLNQWVKQSVRWMPMDKWDACAFPVREEDLEGRVCYGGLDLSSTTDITAFVLVFPPLDDQDKYCILPYFWMSEETLPLRVKRDHVMYDIWAKQGFIQTTEGNVIHYGYIEKFIEKLGERFNIQEIAFDRWGAVQMVQNLEGMGFTVVPFGQGFKDMSPPTKELMKLTLEQRIAHGGHPVLRWMMDNIYIRRDPAGNIKADKEKSTEKIDGAIATIMGLDRAIRCGNNAHESVYDSRGLLFV